MKGHERGQSMKGWRVVCGADGIATDVIPVGDLREHEDGGDCWCNPRQEQPEGFWVHSSADGREAKEKS